MGTQPVFDEYGFTRDDGWWTGRSGYCADCKTRFTAKSGDEVWAEFRNNDAKVLMSCPSCYSSSVFINSRWSLCARFFDWIDAHV